MIRIATKNDISDIIVVATQLYENFEHTYDINNYISNDKYYVIVDDQNGIDGFLLAYNNVDEYELLCIVVDSSKRNQGTGSMLMKQFILDTKNKNIILEVSNINYNAIKLYEKYGFKNIAIRKNYYKDSDALIMKR